MPSLMGKHWKRHNHPSVPHREEAARTFLRGHRKALAPYVLNTPRLSEDREERSPQPPSGAATERPREVLSCFSESAQGKAR